MRRAARQAEEEGTPRKDQEKPTTSVPPTDIVVKEQDLTKPDTTKDVPPMETEPVKVPEVFDPEQKPQVTPLAEADKDGLIEKVEAPKAQKEPEDIDADAN